MKLFFSLLLFIICHVFVFGQYTALPGSVKDRDGKGVPGASVQLMHASDSAAARIEVTDINGSFEIHSIKPGNYFLKVSMIGFSNYAGSVFAFQESKKPEPVLITLLQSATQLGEARVVASKPLVEVRPDMTVLNVENNISTTGSTALELLQKSPGVVVDQDENIYLKGRGGVKIQIDGKPSYLSGEELAAFLKSISANDVESIELISNPSSKYDAEGTAGIINIRMKKNKSFGTNGSVGANWAISKYAKYGLNFNINHRNKYLNAYGSYGNNWGNRENNFYLYRIISGLVFDQRTNTLRDGLNHNYKAGVDVFLNARNTIGVQVNGNSSENNAHTFSKTFLRNEEDFQVDSILVADNKSEWDFDNLNYNINYRYADTSGHELNVDFDLGRYRNRKFIYQPNTYLLPGESDTIDVRNFRSVAPTDIDIYSAKADYSFKLGKGKAGLGIKHSTVLTDNVYDFYNVLSSGDELDTARSNQFEYAEKINAAYLNYSFPVKSFNLQAGIRAEQTLSEGDLTSATTVADKNVKREYTDFFPSAGISWNMDKKNNFSLVYSQRIDRPNYQELNPFEYKLDELTFRKGNPFLDPQYTHKAELSHSYNYTINSSLSYSNTRDYFAMVTDTLNSKAGFISMRNLANEEVYSLNVNVSHQLKKWWSLFFNAGASHLGYRADFGNGKTIDVSLINYTFYIQNTFRLPHDFSLEISGWYSSPGVWGGSFETEANGSLDAGLQKKLFKNAATLKLAVSDIFYTMPWSSRNTLAGTNSRANGDWESRQFRVSFTYRFGNNQVKAARQRALGSESEMKRTSGGE